MTADLPSRVTTLVVLNWLANDLMPPRALKTYLLPTVVYLLYLEVTMLDYCRSSGSWMSCPLGNMPDAAKKTPKYLTPTDSTEAKRI